MFAMVQLSARTCLKMLCIFIHASQREFAVAARTDHPGRVLVHEVAVEPRNLSVIVVTPGALVAARVLVYPHASNRLSGSRKRRGVLVSLTKLSRNRLPIPFVLVGCVGRGNDTTIYERGWKGATRDRVHPGSLSEGWQVHCPSR